MHIIFAFILAVSESPLDSSIAMKWHGIAVGDHISVPTQMNASITDKFSGCSLVRVAELERKNLDYTETYEDGHLISRIPSKVELKFRIEEVLVGNQDLVSATAYGIAWENHSKDLYFQPLFTEWIPKKGDNGLWLVKKFDGRLTCVSLDLAGVRFPVYMSEVHLAAVRSKPTTYVKVLTFARELSKVSNASSPTRNYLVTLAQGENELLARWAAWKLWLQYKNEAITDLRGICSNPNKFPIVQAIADNAILMSEQSANWKLSQERQIMVSQWLSLEGESLEEILIRYLGPTIREWHSLGYETKEYTDLLQRAIWLRKPNSKGWRVLVNFSKSLDRMAEEIRLIRNGVQKND